MRRHAGLLWLAAAVFLASPTAAEEIDEFDRLQLWANCWPMNLFVEPLEHRAAFALTTDDVLTTVRSRLRAARIYDDTAFNYVLNVSVRILRDKQGKQPYALDLEYRKLMTDYASGLEYPARAWRRGSLGVGDHVFVLSLLSKYTDKFIDEYLRVNAEACE